MKIVKILSALAAVCALVIGCAKETPNVWNEIQVSSSYVGLPKDGGSKTITVTAKDSWTISEIPNWLTITPANGSAGETTVTFSAAKATENHENTVKLVCAGKTQSIIVKQEAEKVEPKTLTVAEAIEICNALADKEVAPGEYRVKGIVCGLVDLSVQYGNVTFWISDDGKSVDGKKFEVYRALWLNGAAFKAGDNLDIGDEVIIEGKIMKYGTTPETKEKEAYVYQINKSLIKCDSLVFNGAKLEALPIEGGSFEAALVCKGNGVSVSIPNDAKSWLSVTGIQTAGEKATVTFLAAPNAGGDRSTDITFTTTSGGKEYSAAASVAQKGAILEVSIADFNAAPVGETQYRVSGMVTSIAKAEYGNIYIRDWSGETYIYGIGAKGDFEKTGIKVGDIITVVGKRGAYGTTIEMLNTVVEKVISVTEVDFPTFLAAEKSKDVWYRLTGTITNIEKADYGNLYIKDADGNEIYVYGVYPGYGATGDNRKNFLAAAGIEVGDVLTIEGYKDVYNDKIELCGGVYVSHEKGQVTPPEPPAPTGENVVLTFPDDNSENNKVGSYTDTWTAKIGEQEFTIANFNNNNWNNWSFIKCGRKANESTASITTTIADKISKVTVNFDNVTAADVTSATLYVGETSVTASELKAGDVDFVVAAPAENQTYKLEFVCKVSSENKNGFVVIKKIEYVVAE